MQYQELGKSGIRVSKIALGTWGIGGGSVWSDRNCSATDIQSLLDACRDQGINYIDTAPVYGTGKSEELLGKALQGRRSSFILQSKCSLNWRNQGGNFHYSRDGFTVNNDTSASAIKQDVEDSLKRMHTDYLDSVIVHYVCKSWPVSETVSALEDLIREGKIRTYGLSNSTPADLGAYQSASGQSTHSVSLVQEFFSILSPFHGRDYFPTCEKYGTTFQVYGVLEEGYLTGPGFLNRQFEKADIRARIPWADDSYKSKLAEAYKYFEQLCVEHSCSYANLFESWALNQYENISLLVGMRSTRSVEDTVKCLNLRLTSEELLDMEKAVKAIQVPILDK